MGFMRNNSLLMNLFGKNLISGFTSNRSSRKTKTSSYSRMKKKQISKRRIRNMIARKSRRINRLRAA